MESGFLGKPELPARIIFCITFIIMSYFVGKAGLVFLMGFYYIVSGDVSVTMLYEYIVLWAGMVLILGIGIVRWSWRWVNRVLP